MFTKGKDIQYFLRLKKARKLLLCCLLLTLGKALQAQQHPLYSSTELDSLLQSKAWYCTLPIGAPNFYDSLYKEKLLLPVTHKFEGNTYVYALNFKAMNFSSEGPLGGSCGVESHDYCFGNYYLNGDGTITIRLKWSECRGMLCEKENKRQEMTVSACSYRIFVLDDRLVFKLIE